MIIFNLDGTLADCEHRRHFVEPPEDSCHDCYKIWKQDWQAFYEACDQDTPNTAVLDVFIHLTQGDPFNHDVRVVSCRCESVREKTLKWLTDLSGYTEDIQYWDRRLKMRPIGDTKPDHELKEQWLNDALGEGTLIEFVFDSDPQSIAMWQRRGIFVFDCNQSGREF